MNFGVGIGDGIEIWGWQKPGWFFFFLILDLFTCSRLETRKFNYMDFQFNKLFIDRAPRLMYENSTSTEESSFIIIV